MKGIIETALTLCILAAAGFTALADDLWDGGAGDGLWSSGDNWADNSAPATGGGGVITFNHQGLGSSNVVDQDWLVTSLRYTNGTASLAHTTVVAAASTLAIEGGDLRAGYSMSSTRVVFQGGALRIGGAGALADILIGVNAVPAARTGTVVRIESALNLASLGLLAVGKVLNIGASGAELDLSGASVESGGIPDRLKAAEINVGGGRNRNPSGTLRLPADLLEIETGVFEAGAGAGANKGIALLDFGAGSQLRRLDVTNEFALGRNGLATLVGWPAGVTVTVGRAGAPVPMAVGVTEGAAGCGATLALTNGSFTAYLDILRVGSSDGGAGDTIGLLDLSSTRVQIGDEVDKVKIPELSIGGGTGRNPNGTFRLPSNITEMVVGLLRMGGGNGGNGGNGTLDLGAGSRLWNLTVSNGFFYGTDGQANLVNWPAGVTVTVGSAAAPAPMAVGCTEGDKNNLTVFALTNGSFRGHLSVLEVGVSKTNSTALNTKAYLDLRGTALEALSVTGNVLIGSWPLYNNIAAEGYVYLPTGVVECGGDLLLGDAAADSKGWLELHGTQFRVGRRLEIGPTGTFTNRVAGTSSGLVFDNADTNDFAIAAGGRMAVVFAADPAVPGSLYWGLRMKGDTTAFMRDLTNDTSRFRLVVSGLSPELQPLVGVHYQAAGNFTYLGLQPKPRGTLVMVR